MEELNRNPRFNVVCIAPGVVDTDAIKPFTNIIKQLGVFDDYINRLIKQLIILPDDIGLIISCFCRDKFT